MTEERKFVTILTVWGEVKANIIKAHLESEGIPVLLQYESAGRVYGLTVDGMGQISILVPEDCAQDASHIIQPQDTGQD